MQIHLFAMNLRATSALCNGIALLLALLTFIPAVAAAQPLDDLLATLERLRRENNVPAFAVALVDRDGVIHTDASGLADSASKRVANANTRFRIGSITKTFTALAVLLAAEQKALDVAAPFSAVADANLIDNPWAASVPVRIIDLLEHTAGLADLSREEMFNSDPGPLSLATAVRQFRANREVKWRPREHYSYSNAGAGLAAYALELATNSSYESFVQRHLLAPLAMHRSSLLLDAETKTSLATGYERDGQTPIAYWHMVFRPFGAMNTTAQDMANFLTLFLHRGEFAGRQIVPPAVIARMEQSRTSLAGQHGLDFGYGPGLYSWYTAGHRFFGHGGDGDGYLAHFGYNRAAGRAYFVVINAFSHRPLQQMRDAIEQFLIRDLAPPACAQPAAKPALDRGILGPYRNATSRFGEIALERTTLTLRERDGVLVAQKIDGEEEILVHVRAGLWRHEDEPQATIAIVRDAVGMWTYHGDRASFVQQLR